MEHLGRLKMHGWIGKIARVNLSTKLGLEDMAKTVK